MGILIAARYSCICRTLEGPAYTRLFKNHTYVRPFIRTSVRPYVSPSVRPSPICSVVTAFREKLMDGTPGPRR